MPPHSKTIWEEGAIFKSFLLIKNGVFQEEGKCCCVMHERKKLNSGYALTNKI